MEIPECSICLDIYGTDEKHIRAPKVLKCGDSLCKDCLSKIINKANDSDFFLCPICTTQTKKETNIDNYITNKEIIRIINSIFNIKAPNGENIEDDEPIKYNIISLGDPAVGKTSIFRRLKEEQFIDFYQMTLVIEYYVYYVKYKNIKYKLNFIDTSGQEVYKSLTKNYLRNSDGVLFVFDLSDKESLAHLEGWYELYKNEKGEENINGVLIGNKSDKDIQVSHEDAKNFADKYNLKYYETSAKNDEKIRKAIISLLKKIIDSKALYNSLDSLGSLDTQNNNNAFPLDPKKLKEESFCNRFCKMLNPKNWFK